jgi:hypothetical protein
LASGLQSQQVPAAKLPLIINHHRTISSTVSDRSIRGRVIGWNALVPALAAPGLLFTGLAAWPFFEQWATGDKRLHHVNGRPRNTATRTARFSGLIPDSSSISVRPASWS